MRGLRGVYEGFTRVYESAPARRGEHPRHARERGVLERRQHELRPAGDGHPALSQPQALIGRVHRRQRGRAAGVQAQTRPRQGQRAAHPGGGQSEAP
eukprot:8863678-Pyramimonas_sp.AAC.1